MMKKTFEDVPDKLQNVYCNKVRIGNWFEDSQLADFKWKEDLQQMRRGKLMLARFRMMTETLNKPVMMSQSTGRIHFGDKVGLLAPHVPASDPPTEGKKGVTLQGRMTSDQILYITDLADGCQIILSPSKEPMSKNAFVITSADYCNRKEEILKYNQEFMIALGSSLDKKPLYIRYDRDALPGLNGIYPLYLSEYPVTNCRWRVLPVQKNNITRFEQEDKPITVNTDVVLNHCATNVNLGVNIGLWVQAYYGKVGVPIMKTYLDIYGKELPNNIWQIYTPVQDK